MSLVYICRFPSLHPLIRTYPSTVAAFLLSVYGACPFAMPYVKVNISVNLGLLVFLRAADGDGELAESHVTELLCLYVLDGEA